MHAAINGPSGRDLEADDIHMAPLEPSVHPAFLSFCPPQGGISCSRTATGRQCWLLCCIDLGNGHHYSHSRHCPLNPAQEPCIHNPFSLPFACPADLHSNLTGMVRHYMKSRREGTRGGSARPQAAQSSAPTSPPQHHENSPPPRSPHSHYPHTRSGRGQGSASMAAHSDIRLHTAISPLLPGSIPHSTQFRFQSSLNRPIITANMTIVFSEEDEQNNDQARNSEEHSQEVRNPEMGRGSKKKSKDDGVGASHSRLHGGEAHTSDIKRAGGSSTGVAITTGFVGSSSSTQHAREPPGGAAKGDVAEKDEDWDQYACLIVEETPDEDDNK